MSVKFPDGCSRCSHRISLPVVYMHAHVICGPLRCCSNSNSVQCRTVRPALLLCPLWVQCTEVGLGTELVVETLCTSWLSNFCLNEWRGSLVPDYGAWSRKMVPKTKNQRVFSFEGDSYTNHLRTWNLFAKNSRNESRTNRSQRISFL